MFGPEFTLATNGSDGINWSGIVPAAGQTFSDQNWLNPPQYGRPKHVPKIGNPIYDQNRDLHPYGVRDMVPGPVDRNQNEHRTELYDQPYNSNKPAMTNWETMFPEGTDEAKRWGAEYYNIVRDSSLYLRNVYLENGTFNVPYTGFTALRHIRPGSTLAWI